MVNRKKVENKMSNKHVTFVITENLHKALLKYQLEDYIKNDRKKKVTLRKIITSLLAERLNVELEEGWDS